MSTLLYQHPFGRLKIVSQCKKPGEKLRLPIPIRSPDLISKEMSWSTSGPSVGRCYQVYMIVDRENR